MRLSRLLQTTNLVGALLQTAVIALFFSLAGTLAAQSTPTITFKATTNGQPASGVSIYVIAGANKISSTTPPAGNTDSSGAFVLPAGLVSANKLNARVEVYVAICVNGQKQEFVVPKGEENLLPEDTQDCKRRRAGVVLWVPGSTIDWDASPNGHISQTGVNEASSTPGIQVEAEGYGGGAYFWDASTAFWAAHFAVDLPLGGSPFFLAPGVTYEKYTTPVTVSQIGSMTPGPTGGTFEVSTVALQGGVLDAMLGVRTGGFRIKGGPGVAFADLTTKSVEGFCGGSAPTCATLSTSSQSATVARLSIQAEAEHKIASIKGGELVGGVHYQHEFYNHDGVGGTNVIAGKIGIVIGH